MGGSRSKYAELLGKNVTRWRKSLGLTQEQVASRLGVEPETISRFERGVTLPSLPTLASLAQILGTTMAQLLEEESPPEFSQAKKIAAWIEAVPKSEQQFVMNILSQLCGHLAKPKKRTSRQT